MLAEECLCNFEPSTSGDGFFYLLFPPVETIMTKMTTIAAGVLTLCCLLAPVSVPAAEKTLTLMTHDSFNVSKELIARFEEENNVTLRVFKAGDAGAALVQAILSRGNPMADVFYGVDNTFLSRALKADIFLPYASPQLGNIDFRFRLDPDNRLLPVDYGDVCLNYDKSWFAANDIAPPGNLEDLVKPQYKGLTVVENPATSSPGMAFLLATIGRFGENGYLEYWKKLRANDVLVANGWEDAYFSHFTAASKGSRPIVVSYASSPAAAVHYSEKPLDTAPTAAVTTDASAFRQVEFVGILKGTKNLEKAQKLVDFMLARPFQEDIPLQMFVFPTNRKATLPEVFIKFAVVAEKPAVVAPAAIEKNREKWLEAWTDAVLR
jgi:thiamine transport system substrate-binding protein